MTSLKISVGAGCLTLALGGVGLMAAAAASAANGHESGMNESAGNTPPAMEIATSTSGHIQTAGTQGTLASAHQCTEVSSVTGCVTQSFEATPQLKAPNKMTK